MYSLYISLVVVYCIVFFYDEQFYVLPFTHFIESIALKGYIMLPRRVGLRPCSFEGFNDLCLLLCKLYYKIVFHCTFLITHIISQTIQLSCPLTAPASTFLSHISDIASGKKIAITVSGAFVPCPYLSVYLSVLVHGHPEIYRDIFLMLIVKKISVAFVSQSSLSLCFSALDISIRKNIFFAFVPGLSISLYVSAQGIPGIYDLQRHLYQVEMEVYIAFVSNRAFNKLQIEVQIVHK